MITKNKIKLGIIGGAGPMASALLYQMLIQDAQRDYKACEDQDFPEIIIINFPFSPMISEDQSLHNTKQLIDELQNCFNQLASLGVSHALIACNTLHTLLAHIDVKKMNIISLITQTIESALPYKRTLVLQTPTTAKSDLYTAQATTIVSNEKQDQEKISAIINAVLQGTITKELADALVDCIKQSATTDPCDAVILGCTELSVINHYFPLDTYLSDQKITIIDPLKIAAKYILNITYT